MKITLQTIIKKSQICLLKGVRPIELFHLFCFHGSSLVPRGHQDPKITTFCLKIYLFHLFPLPDLALMQAACSTELAAEPHSGTRHCRNKLSKFMVDAPYSPCSVAGLNVRLSGVPRWHAAGVFDKLAECAARSFSGAVRDFPFLRPALGQTPFFWHFQIPSSNTP